MVGLLAAVGAAMSALVSFAHGDLVWVTIADAAAATGLAAYLAAAPPIKKMPSLCKSLTVECYMRITVAVARVLAVFLSDDDHPRYGYELMSRTGYPSGKVYPILEKLTAAGWLIREREDINPSLVGRPARCMYALSAQGATSAKYELALLSRQLAPTQPELSLPGSLAVFHAPCGAPEGHALNQFCPRCCGSAWPVMQTATLP